MQRVSPLSLSHAPYPPLDEWIPNLTIQVEPLGFVGQERAIQAIQMGLEITSKGYNILVIGPQGCGKRSAVSHLVEQYRTIEQPLQDIVLVNNYQLADYPHVLHLPAGQAVHLREQMHALLTDIKAIVAKQSQTEDFKKQRDKLFQDLENTERQSLQAFEKRLSQHGLRVVHIEDDEQGKVPDLVPVYKGKVTTFDHLEELLTKGEILEEQWQNLRERYYHYMDEMKQIFNTLRFKSQEVAEKIAKLNRDIVQPELQKLINALKKQFPLADVQHYLDETYQDILLHLAEFYREDEQPREEGFVDLEKQYGVNILINNQNIQQRPFVVENNPTWGNLFGLIESKPEGTDFMSVKAGSLLQASGGFLAMRLEDLLREDEVWCHLKRVLNSQEVVIQNLPSPLAQGVSLKPDPVKISVKVILLSSEILYEHLYLQDEEFQKLFKILAEFDETMPCTKENCCKYLAFVQKITQEEHLLPLTKEGFIELLHYGIQLTERQNRMSCCLALVADRLREAHYWANKLGLCAIDQTAMRKAEHMRTYFHNLPQEAIWREMQNHQLLIDVDGEAIGKINALVVIDRGSHTFGFPTVITAQTFAGKDGIVNIEREVGLSGEIHDKGVFILEGFLNGRFARRAALGVSASLCFEQSYDGVEGDSATLAETCALLSALGKFPIKQGIAITGSMNQMGVVQPVGGISKKINGFFQVCQQFGLTGRQGVIFPASNIENIFISTELENALSDGLFFLWPVSIVEEALAILTGMDVGQLDKKGRYPARSLFGRIEQELKCLNS